MYKFAGRLFARPKLRPSSSAAVLRNSAVGLDVEGATRRAFLAGGGAAVGSAAVVLATPKVVALATDASGSSVPADPAAVATTPSGPAPHEPVTAYVRNAEDGEVTVMSGQKEATYYDPALVKRLLDAAH
jgi:hypothetical protein